MRTFSFGVFILLCTACDPYLTRQINNISNQYKGDSIYVAGPLIETRLQITKDSFTGDGETIEPAERLTKKVLHQLFDQKLKVKYDQTDRINSWRTKIALDSLLEEFKKAQYASYSINKSLQFPTGSELILIPYFIWTRTTREYESEKCGRGGRNYILNDICYWTRSQTYLFVINRGTNEIIYFKSNQWYYADILLPYEKRVTKSFKRCAQPLLGKLQH